MMRLPFFLPLVAFLFPSGNSLSQSFKVKSYQTFDLKIKTNIRAIDVLNDSVVWVSGSNGVYGFTYDDGAHWQVDSIKIGSLNPDFRSLAILGDNVILLLNAGSPAYIMKSFDRGKTWKTVYENDSKEIFFDAMKFSDEKNGVAVGDPVGGEFQILETHDSGEHWEVKKNLPSAFMGEACFAASNSCFDLEKNMMWIGTGGSYNRVLSLYDKSRNWSSSTALVQCCASMKGIFSLDFYDEKNGIVVGGDYDKKEKSDSTVAITSDGGNTWKLISSGQVTVGSCVQFRPHSQGKTILVASLPGIYESTDGGEHWQKLVNDKGNEISDSYYTFQFSPSGKVAWFAGANGKIARMEFN